jgi:hypothetical protein
MVRRRMVMYSAVTSTIAMLLSANAPNLAAPGAATSLPPPSPVPITIFAAAVATLVSCALSCIFNIWLFRVSSRAQERRSIQDLIVRIIDISIAYPLV